MHFSLIPTPYPNAKNVTLFLKASLTSKVLLAETAIVEIVSIVFMEYFLQLLLLLVIEEDPFTVQIWVPRLSLVP